MKNIYIAITKNGHICGIGRELAGLKALQNDPRYVQSEIIANVTANDLADMMTYFFQENKTAKARKTKIGYIIK